jgi:putative membrane protein
MRPLRPGKGAALIEPEEEYILSMIWKIFFRDLKRLGSNLIALIVIIGVCLIPALYAWFNIAANMDPYSNTRNIKIAVVNLDQGGTFHAASFRSSAKNQQSNIALGSMVVKNLKKNVQLGWQFVGSRQAMKGVQSGKYYAAIVIPSNFSSSILSILNGKIHRPQIIYYSNEKKNAVAPKVTDTGASTIQLKINQTFVSVVSDTITQALGTSIADSRGRLTNAKNNVLSSLSSASENLSDSQKTISSFQNNCRDAQKTISATNKLLDHLNSTSADALVTVNNTEKLLKAARKSSLSYAGTLNNSADTVSAAISSLQNDTMTASGKLTSSISRANAEVDSQITQMNTIIRSNQEMIDQLESLHELLKTDTKLSSDISRQIALLNEQNAKCRKILSALESANSAVSKANTQAEELNSSISSLTAAGNKNLQKMKNSLYSGSTETMNDNFNTAITACESAKSIFEDLPSDTKQVRSTLKAVSRGLSSTSSALSASKNTLKAARKDLEQIRTDLNTLVSSAAYKKLLSMTNTNTKELASFMANPIKMQSHVFYPVKNYGSAMTPFYTDLAIWVSGIILAAILKLRADADDAIPEFTAAQAYFGRWLLFIFLGLIQAAIIAAGDLYFLKVQCLHPVWFFIASLITSFVFVSVEYSLCLTFNHIGRALCVLLVILQIPASSGTYPIEMTPQFFQRLHPLLPFSYSIKALRECIAGYYDHSYWKNLGILMIFAGLALFFGLVVQRAILNLNNLFDDRLARTGFMSCEKESAVRSRASLSQMLQILTEEQEGRQAVVERGIRFEQKYPRRVKRGFRALLIIPLIFLFLAFGINHKLLFLSLWVISMVAIAIYLIVLEYIHDNLINRLGIRDVPQEELLQRIRTAASKRRKRRKGDDDE